MKNLDTIFKILDLINLIMIFISLLSTHLLALRLCCFEETQAPNECILDLMPFNPCTSLSLNKHILLSLKVLSNDFFVIC